MAKYTTQIRTIVESGHNIFDFDYPLFDEQYKPILEKKIIDYYFYREIGLETVAQFKHFLKSRLQIIMPYYNQMYESTLLDYDPLNNLNTTEQSLRKINTKGESKGEGTGSQSGKATGKQTSDGTNRNVFSDTPTSKLGDLDYATEINDGKTSDETNNESNSESNSHGTSKNESAGESLDEYIVTQKGSGGMRYPADIIMEWRKAFINVDQMIIDELADLFMNVY